MVAHHQRQAPASDLDLVHTAAQLAQRQLTQRLGTREGGAVREQRVRREAPERDDDPGLQQLDLAQQPGLALRDLDRVGIAVVRRAALDHVRDVDLVLAVQPHRGEHAVEQLAGAADEGQALAVLLLARRLADDQPVGRRVSHAGHRVAPARSEVAGAAGADRIGQRGLVGRQLGERDDGARARTGCRSRRCDGGSGWPLRGGRTHGRQGGGSWRPVGDQRRHRRGRCRSGRLLRGRHRLLTGLLGALRERTDSAPPRSCGDGLGGRL